MIILYSKSILYPKSILYSKSCAFMWVADFWFRTRLLKPRHFYSLSSLGTMSDHNWRVFHPRGDLSQLVDTRHIFSLPFQSTVRLCWTLSHLTKPTQSNTKHSVDLSTMNSHPFNALSPCICNAIMPLQVISFHMHDECYMRHLHTIFYTQYHA